MRTALEHAGLPAGAVNLLAVPSELGLFDDAATLPWADFDENMVDTKEHRSAARRAARESFG